MLFDFRQKVFLLMLLFCIVQNSFLVEHLNYLGLSVSFFFSFLLIVASFFVKDGFVELSKFEKASYFLFLLISVLGFYLYWGQSNYSELGQAKGVKLLLLNFLFIVPFYLNISLEIKKVVRVLLVMLAVCTLAFVLLDMMGLGTFFKSIVYHSSHDGRPRGLSAESSYFGATVTCISLAILAFAPRHLKYVAILGIILVLLSTSKGSVACLILAVLISRVILHPWNKVLFGLSLTLMFFLAFYFSVVDFSVEFEGGTSFATRFTVWYLAIDSFFHNLLGVSYAGYLAEFNFRILNAVQFVSDIPVFGDDANLYEVANYINTDQSSNIGTKSYFMDNLIAYGLVFLCISFAIVSRAIRSVKEIKIDKIEHGISEYWCMTLVIFMVLSLIVFIHGVGFYFYPALFMLVNNVNRLR
ncbi:MAG: hypothetical protein V7785_08700 [Bermanella sp.]